MPLEFTQILSLLSFLVAAIALSRNLKGDVKNDAGQQTEIIVKLETINENVKEMKTDVKDVKNDMEKMKERLVIVEQSCKTAHKRIDTLHDKRESEEQEERL